MKPTVRLVLGIALLGVVVIVGGLLAVAYTFVAQLGMWR